MEMKRTLGFECDLARLRLGESSASPRQERSLVMLELCVTFLSEAKFYCQKLVLLFGFLGLWSWSFSLLVDMFQS